MHQFTTVVLIISLNTCKAACSDTYASIIRHREFIMDPEVSIMYQVTESLIKQDKCYVSLKEDYNRRPLPSSLGESEIDQVWKDRLAKNKKLYNGTKFRVHSAYPSPDNHALNLQLGVTCYKDFLGTNWSPCSENLQKIGFKDYGNPQAYMSDALGVGALLLTTDLRMILLKRSQYCAEALGLWDIPGGHAEPQELVGLVGIESINVETLSPVAVVEEIYNSILREIRDEVNIPETVLSEPELMGIARNLTSAGRPSLEFLVRCSLSSSEIVKLYMEGNQREADESTNIQSLCINKVLDLKLANKQQWETLAPSAKGCLILYKNLVNSKILSIDGSRGIFVT